MDSENTFKKQFAKRLKELRQLTNLSQEELAEKVGVAEKTVSYWENCHNSVALSKIPILAEALNVPEYALFIFDNSIKVSELGPLSAKDKKILEKIIKLYLSRSVDKN